MTPVRVGVVGGGWVATARHIPGYRSHGDAEVVALYDRRSDRAETVARDQKIPRWTASLDEMFDLEVDVISICTPPWTHAEIAVAAFERGVHVFTEKPMAMNYGDATAMVDAARAAGRHLCVSHNFLYSRAVQRADALLATLPSVAYAMGVQMSSLERRLPTWYAELPGGLLFDELPHMLYTLEHFLGELSLDDVRGTRRPDGHVGNVEIQLRADDRLAQVVTVFDSPISEWHIGLISPGGVVDLDLFRDISVHIKPDHEHKAGDILRTSAKAMAEHGRGFVTSGVRLLGRRLYWGHDVIIRKFIDAVQGRGEVPIPAERSAAIVRLTDDVVAQLV